MLFLIFCFVFAFALGLFSSNFKRDSFLMEEDRGDLVNSPRNFTHPLNEYNND